MQQNNDVPEPSTAHRILRALALGLALLAIIYICCLIAAHFLGVTGPRDIDADSSMVV